MKLVNSGRPSDRQVFNQLRDVESSTRRPLGCIRDVQHGGIRRSAKSQPLRDPAGYTAELDIVEGVFRSVLAQQSTQK
jgi:hypothetical protein